MQIRAQMAERMGDAAVCCLKMPPLQNQYSRRSATELHTGGPIRRTKGPDKITGAAARQRMAALYDLRECSRIPANINTGTNRGRQPYIFVRTCWSGRMVDCFGQFCIVEMSCRRKRPGGGGAFRISPALLSVRCGC